MIPKIIDIKNPGGAPRGNNNASKNKMWSDALRKIVTQRQLVDVLANILVEKALSGDVEAIREIMYRLEGKPSKSSDKYKWEI